MSLFDSASLCITPNGYKEDKLYSIKPTDGSGDLDVVRATTATRVNSEGLIEIVPKNILTYSEQFDNASWGKTNTTITSNTEVAPNGSTTADSFIPNTTSAQHYLSKNYGSGIVSTSSTTYSVYAKANGQNWLFLYVASSSPATSAYFNLSTGVVGTNTSGSNATIVSVGDGWYRCSITHNVSGTTVVTETHSSLSGTTLTYLGNGTDGLFLWGAQLEQGTLTDYFPTTDRLDVPRLDYTNGGCPSILVEPQRTNLILRSEEFDNAVWLKINATVTANYGISPDGTQNADRLQFNVANTSSVYRAIGVATTDANTIYVKGVAGEKVLFGYGANVSVGTLFTLNGEWQRLEQISTTGTVFHIGNYSGGTASDILIWGAQREAGSNATSYIPTVASTSTRNADVISKTGISNLIGQTDGTLFVDANLNVNANERRLLTISNGTETQRIIIWTLGTVLYTSFNGVSVNLGNFPIGTTKIAIGYTISGGSTTYSIKVNNNTLVTGTAAAAPNPLSAINLGSRITTGLELNDRISNSIAWKTRLTNDELAQLTTI